MDMQDDFDISYGGSNQSERNLADGRYVVEVKSVKKTNMTKTARKFAGCAQLEWKCKIQGGPLSKLEFVCATFLEPEEMLWTTDRVIQSVYPAIQPGQKVSPLDLIGKRLEMQIKTRMNDKENKVSMYVNLERCFPYVDEHIAGNLGDLGASDERNPGGDIP
jgi:hypothetical protein